MHPSGLEVPPRTKARERTLRLALSVGAVLVTLLVMDAALGVVST